jgi:hypothetical protein
VETDKWYKFIGFFTIVGAIAALLVVPEVRQFIGLNSQGVSSPVGIDASNRASPPQNKPTSIPPQNNATQRSKDRYTVRVFNCDDGGRALVNGGLVTETGFGDDSGWIDITERLDSRDNSIKFQVINNVGAITYGFQVRKNGSIIFERECGTHHRYGCEDNRQDFPIGIAREFDFNVPFP